MYLCIYICIYIVCIYIYIMYGHGPLDVYIYIYILYIYIYNIYIYMLPPPKSTGFDFLLCFTVIFVGFCLQKQPAFFHSFEDFGCLNMMSHDASCVDTMTYFDGICSAFVYSIGFPAKSFNSNIDRMRTALWPNVNFKLYIGFYNVFVPSCDPWNFGFCMLSDLAGILFDDQHVFGES